MTDTVQVPREPTREPEFRRYQRTAIAEMADWTPGMDLTGVSISDADKQAGSPRLGDKIARNPKNHADRWLVAADYFADNFAAAPEPMAWLYTMDNTDGIPGNEPKTYADTVFHAHPFGIPVRDLSVEYPVTTTPLYTHPKEPVNQQLLEALRMAEQALRGKAYDEEGYCLDPDLAEDADKARAALQAALAALPRE